MNVTQEVVNKLQAHFNGSNRGRTAKHTDLLVPFKYATNKHGDSKKVGARPVLQRIKCLYLGGKVGTNTGDVFQIELNQGPGHIFRAVA